MAIRLSRFDPTVIRIPNPPKMSSGKKAGGVAGKRKVGPGVEQAAGRLAKKARGAAVEGKGDSKSGAAVMVKRSKDEVYAALPGASGKLLTAMGSCMPESAGYATYAYSPKEGVYYQSGSTWRLGQILYPSWKEEAETSSKIETQHWFVQLAAGDTRGDIKDGHHWGIKPFNGRQLIPAARVAFESA